MYGRGNQQYEVRFGPPHTPDVIKWLVEGGSSNDPEARKKAYSAAVQRITERAYWAPLFTTVSTYAHAKALDFTPYADELPRFDMAKWK